MTQRNFLKSGLAAAALILAASASQAAPTVLDFSELQNIGNKKVSSIQDGGYTLSNNCAGNACFKGGKDSLRSDVGGSWTTLKKDDGKVFDLLSIQLDDVYNGFWGPAYSDYKIDFTFKYASGKEGKKTVFLDQTFGFQTFNLNETYLRSASWMSTAYLRFDNIQTSPIPEPTTLALLPLALGGAFLASRRRKSAGK
ncbi:PEP-CTERM sorting domain-containing protein [Paucibacter sp. Y2R2-4]|uniref:PEP-CTERM sorting domain-containing protein n=1 Tax=Paucibacter sp. Y2R2-4 TaxID=2893553 RepID=UPI0021E4B857|nr:PEP-CTERM sorting domain-containing protein [Paucibacter sp. Y2R2-4]MCV2349511.1 PEP-CTERM sorting domain-containing protein [Paucibacter sp. Y2R2-4]